MSDPLIRDARPADGDAIREVTLAAYREYAPQLSALWEAYRRNILATLARIQPAEQVVAERDGRVVGTVLLYPGGAALPGREDGMPWPEVRLLAVAPQERGRGIAQALMAECVRRARGAGATALTLHTTDMMTTAVRLYERMGFRRDPALDFQPAPGLTIKGFRLDFAAPAPP